MPAVVLDACGAINLYATGRLVEILAALEHTWYLPAAVERESQLYRQPDPDDPDSLISVAMDFGPAIDAGVLCRCECRDDRELELYVELAARIRDDGESMGLAVAKCRGWSVLTDDRKARRIAGELGVPVVGTPEVLKLWSIATGPDVIELSRVLGAIERFANYRPGRGAPGYDWWIEAIRLRR